MRGNIYQRPQNPYHMYVREGVAYHLRPEYAQELSQRINPNYQALLQEIREKVYWEHEERSMPDRLPDSDLRFTHTIYGPNYRMLLKVVFPRVGMPGIHWVEVGREGRQEWRHNYRFAEEQGYVEEITVNLDAPPIIHQLDGSLYGV